jgi:hypothetical protein
LAIGLAATIACVATPVALTLLPLAASQVWRMGLRTAAILLLFTGLACGIGWIDVRALAAWPPTFSGPWLMLLVGAVATSTAWSLSTAPSAHDLIRAAGIVALIAAPWSPWCGLLFAASALIVAHCLRSRAIITLVAANDNDPVRCSPHAPHRYAPVSSPPLRSARPSAYD